MSATGLTKFSEEALREAMSRACLEARRWVGSTSPNPPVGAAALNANGKVIAVMAHQRAGSPHAEARLLRHCREQGLLANVAGICVTLEPCNHQGRTPPCTAAILEAGIGTVVVGVRDPNPDVKGGGIAELQRQGVDVAVGVAEDECHLLLHAFAYSVVNRRPWITVKRAFTVAGSMIPPRGRKTFTSSASLVLAHRLRKKTDAILTGSGTILADNPMFTVRRIEDYPHKRRWLAILDRRRRVPKSYLDEARERGFDPLVHDSIEVALADLHERGARDVLVEAGPAISEAVLEHYIWCLTVDIRQGIQDRVICTINPQISVPFATAEFDIETVLPLP